ncbi:hypothetical protein [Kitasatospora indigofera]|uniref:hypothetical protein n=1 Tax=Kitasatospora indigofera TaxID=67307 RepID=UPI00324964F9
MNHRALRAVAALAVTALLAGGCSSAGADPEKKRTPSMDASEARTKIDALLDGTTKAIVPAVQFSDDAYTSSENTEGMNDRPDGTTHLSKNRYVMTKVAQAKYGALLGLVERYWKSQGYTITSVNSDDRMPAIDAQAGDGVGVHIQIGFPGNVTLSAGVGAVEDPQTRYPFGPGTPLPTDAKGNQDLMPKVEDPFWSH